MTGTIGDLDTDLDQRPRGKRRRNLLWLALGVAVLAGAGAAAWYTAREDDAASRDTSPAPATTTEVSRTTIADTETYEGALGYGEGTAVPAGRPGIVTRAAEQDAVVERGTELYRLDEQPVTALIGAVPMYRDLAAGATGVDVEQLETNLAALGYAGFTVDDEFTWSTQVAVQQWQEDIGADETGVVAKGDVVFLPAGGRIGAVHADVGSGVAPGAPVLEVTGAAQVVTMSVDVAERNLLATGAAVTVALPGGTAVPATVTSADVVETAPGGAESDTGDSEATGADAASLDVEATLDEPVDEAFDGAPVDVTVQVDRREDVLVVPVNALLALTDGGHGVEVIADDGTTSIVPVETGLFADGRVEVSGSGIAAGTVVGVAGR